MRAGAIGRFLLRGTEHFFGFRGIDKSATANFQCNRFVAERCRGFFLGANRLYLQGNRMSSNKPKVVFVLGGPGAGKGTQCQKIVDTYGFVHLSAGDLLREERSRSGSEYAELIEDAIKNGKIVPVEVTCSLLENAMNKFMKDAGKNKFLIDGFPRNQDNMDGWNRKMSDKVELLFVLFFDCAEDVCVERCLDRGKSGSGRSDDNLESLKKRIQTYQNDSLPIIEFYKDLDLVRRVDASPGPDLVFENVQKTFSECKSLRDAGDS